MKKRREGGKEERGRRDVEVTVRERQRDSNIGRSADADCDPHFVILKEFFFYYSSGLSPAQYNVYNL